MVLMTNGSVFFLNNNKETETSPTPVELNISLYAEDKKFKYIPLIAPIDGKAFVATQK